MKKSIIILFCIIGAIIIIVSCGFIIKENNKEEKEVLTIERLKSLVKDKQDKITWSDFKNYKHVDIGSGIYLYQYEVGDQYKLQIGGKSLDADPDFIYLIKDTGEQIDIRAGNIEEFIGK